MASTQKMCNSFKQELLQGFHVFTATNPARAAANTADTIKIALFLDAATLCETTITYSTSSECTSSGSYAPGGSNVAWNAPGLTSPTVFISPSGGTVSWTTFTATGFSAALIYNSTQANKAISVHTFASQSITAGTFTITYPANTAGSAILNFV